MSRSRADECILQFGERVGMPGLRLDAAGSCQLLFDGRWLVTLTLDPGGGRLWLSCPLSAAGSAGGLATQSLVALLQANFMGRGAAGAGGCMAAGPDGRIYIQQPVGLDGSDAVATLHNVLEHLLNQAEKWAARLENGPASAPARAQSGRDAPDWLARRV